MRGIEQYLQVDAATLGALKYQGTWDASTNTPTLTSGVGVQGQYYVVSVAGSTNLNGETNWQVGDWAVFNGSVWQKVDGGSTGLLTTLTVTGNTYLATTSGSVGVGTTSILAGMSLDVDGLAAVGTQTAVPGIGGNIRYRDDTGTQRYAVGILGAPAETGFSFYDVVASTERMRLDSSGNLGIGTGSPGAKLDVVGAGIFRLDGAGSTTPLILRNNNTTSVQAVKLGFDSSGAIKSSINAAVYGNDYMTFNVGSDTERMRITSTGDVGIGTSSPASRLHVSGVSSLAASSGSIAANVSGATPSIAGGQGILQILSTDAAAADAGGVLTFTANTTSAANYVMGGIAGKYQTTGAGVYGGYLQFLTTSSAGTPTERMRLDSSGNLGLGGTPAAWGSTSKALGIAASAAAFVSARTDAFRLHVGLNAYESASDVWNYTASLAASRYTQIDGQHQWFNAASGTAGNAISFTQAMTLDASGNLGIGTTSEPFARGYSKWLAVSGSAAAAIEINAATGDVAYFDMGVNGTRSFSIINDGVTPSIAAVGALPLTFSTNSIERTRIDSSGNWMAGTTTAIGRATVVGGSSQLSFHDGNGSNTNYGYLNYGGSSGELTLNANSTGGNTAIRFLTSNGGANAERVRIDYAGSLGLGGSSFGSGALVMFIANATTAPTTNPTGGGVLYVEAGALKYRGSSGTVTTIANA